MQTTTNYDLKKPEGNEFVSIDDLNENADKVDKVLKGLDDNKVDATDGDIANTKVSSFSSSTTQWPVPAAGEAPKTLWGKVKKFIEDFKNWMTGVCLIGQIVNNCVTNNASLPLSAAQGKVLMDLYTVLNAKQTFLGRTYWSIPESFNVGADQWTTSAHSISLPSGAYVISAHAELPAGDSPAALRVDNLLPVQRWITIPTNSVHVRRATVTFFADFSTEIVLTASVYCLTATPVNTCEVSALRIK